MLSSEINIRLVKSPQDCKLVCRGPANHDLHHQLPGDRYINVMRIRGSPGSSNYIARQPSKEAGISLT